MKKLMFASLMISAATASAFAADRPKFDDLNQIPRGSSVEFKEPQVFAAGLSTVEIGTYRKISCSFTFGSSIVPSEAVKISAGQIYTVKDVVPGANGLGVLLLLSGSRATMDRAFAIFCAHRKRASTPYDRAMKILNGANLRISTNVLVEESVKELNLGQ